MKAREEADKEATQLWLQMLEVYLTQIQVIEITMLVNQSIEEQELKMEEEFHRTIYEAIKMGYMLLHSQSNRKATR